MKKIVCFLSCITACVLLFSQTPAPLKLVDFVLTPDHANWNYTTGESATVTVTVLKAGVPVKNVVVSYEAGGELLAADKKDKISLAEGTGKIMLGTSVQPGFRYLKTRVTVEGKTYSGEIKLAFSPERIQPTVGQPADFAAFWDTAKAEAAKVPMDAMVTWLPEKSTGTIDVYLVQLQHTRKGQRLYGYLCKPKAPGKYPVLLEVPGAGIKPITPMVSYAERGFITLNIEIHGISPLLSAESYAGISSAFGDYYFHRADNRDQYYYKHVYLGCVRAVDYLCSLPEFDGKNVVVTGGSQGGALTMVTAALDKRVTCLAAFYPALCDLTGYLHGRAGGWPHILGNSNQQYFNKPEVLHTLAYYDVVNFARHIKAPGFYSWGYNDNTTPPTSVFAAVNSVQAPKTIIITPISGHWRFPESNEAAMEWVQQQLVRP